MAKMYTKEQIVQILRDMQGDRTQRELAAELGISQTYLHDIYRGAKDPGESVLRALGFERLVRYVKVD